MDLGDNVDAELVHHVFLEGLGVGAADREGVVGTFVGEESGAGDEVVEGSACDFDREFSCFL